MNTKQLDKKLNSAVGGLEKTVLLAEVDADEMELVVEDMKIASVTAVNEFKDTDFVKVVVEGQTFNVHRSQMHVPLTELMEAVLEERERKRLTAYLSGLYPKAGVPYSQLEHETQMTPKQIKNWYFITYDKPPHKPSEIFVAVADVVELLLLISEDERDVA